MTTVQRGSVRKICVVCGSAYRASPARASTTKYCSRSCELTQRPRAIVRRPPPKWSKLYIAIGCGHLTRRGRKFCKTCFPNRHANWVSIKCTTCGTSIKCRTYDLHKRKTCSKKCHNDWVAERQRGDKSHLWRGGLVTENRRLRNSREADQWRRQVYARDNFTCQACGERGGKLCVDHIKPWCGFPDLRFDLGNGRTLCWPCHRKTPTFGRRALVAA